MIRNSMTRKIPFELIYLLTGFLVLAVATITVLSFANTAFTMGTMQEKDMGSLNGEVTMVDSGIHWRTLTLRSDEIGRYPNDTLNIFLSPDTKVEICGMSEPGNDISVSSNVTITYHEVGGVAVADSVAERC